MGQGGWSNDILDELTIPAGAGPGDARIVITSTLPPPLTTYVTNNGPYKSGIIFYAANDDTTYTYMCVIDNAGGGYSQVDIGQVLSGSVMEESVGTPSVISLFVAGSGIPTVKEILASAINIRAGVGDLNLSGVLSANLISGTKSVFVDSTGTTVEGNLKWKSGGIQSTSRKVTDNTARTTGSVAYTTVLAPVGTLGDTFVAAASGQQFVHLSANVVNNGAFFSIMGFQVKAGAVIGAGTLFQAVSDDEALISAGVAGLNENWGRTFLLTGLTPGATYNIECQQRVSGGTGTFLRRNIITSPAL